MRLVYPRLSKIVFQAKYIVKRDLESFELWNVAGLCGNLYEEFGMSLEEVNSSLSDPKMNCENTFADTQMPVLVFIRGAVSARVHVASRREADWRGSTEGKSTQRGRKR